MPQTLTGDTTVDQVDENAGITGGTVSSEDPPIYDVDGNELDLKGSIDALLADIGSSGFDRAAKLQDMFLEMGANIDPSALTASEQTALNTIKENIARTSDADREQAVALLTHRGLGRSTDVAESFGHFAEKKLVGQAMAEAGFITDMASQKRQQQTDILGLAAKVQSEVTAGKLDYAKTLLDAWNATENRELNSDQLELQRDIFEENAWLGRAEFTEEQRQNMINNGFTERQIAGQEKMMAFEMDIRQKEFQASTDLARKNFALTEKVQLGTLALSELKNNHDMSIEDRAADLAEKVQLGTLDLESDKFELYAKQLEREYGLDLNRFELARFVETGRLNAEVINAQRAYDLQDEKQQQEFLLSSASLKLQEVLGFREQDIRYALGQGSITVQHEANLITRWAEENRLRLDEKALEFQIQNARDERRGSLLGGILGGIVRIGAGLISNGASEIFLNAVNGASRE